MANTFTKNIQFCQIVWGFISLRITAAEINDTGTWTLIADNRLGQVARKQIALKVHPSSMPIEVKCS